MKLANEETPVRTNRQIMLETVADAMKGSDALAGHTPEIEMDGDWPVVVCADCDQRWLVGYQPGEPVDFESA